MDRDADFTGFVVARSARLVHIAHMLCGDRALAEDIVQTALERAYLRWDRIEQQDPFGYVRRAVVNEHLNWRRRRPWREQAVGGTAELEAGSPHRPVGDHAAGVQYDAVLAAALARLTRRERAVMVLRYVEDLTETQTAQVLGVALGTVKSTASRALTKLRSSPELAEIYVGGPA